MLFLHKFQIMTEVKSGRYNVACTRYFEAVHKLPLEYQAQAVSHPNQYFEESQRVTNSDSKCRYMYFIAERTAHSLFFWFSCDWAWCVSEFSMLFLHAVISLLGNLPGFVTMALLTFRRTLVFIELFFTEIASTCLKHWQCRCKNLYKKRWWTT